MWVGVRWMTLAVGAGLLWGCGGEREEAIGHDSAAAALVPRREVLSLSDMAGMWTVRVLNEAGDSVLTTYILRATGAPAGWTIKYRDRESVPLRVTVDADSLIYETAAYESVLRPGVRVRSHGSSHLVDGRLVGTFTSTFEVAAPDSVLRGRTEGTRHP